MSKIPGIANIPILGQFFRSKNFNHSVVELVIIVTATVVDPLDSSVESSPSEPKLVVPNLDTDAFDVSARGKFAAHSPASTPQPQPTTQIRPDVQ
jgi:Flp pilus assembly secretin CpaC